VTRLSLSVFDVISPIALSVKLAVWLLASVAQPA
jgi:hypothetical protein